jgi:hypothetical protein
MVNGKLPFKDARAKNITPIPNSSFILLSSLKLTLFLQFIPDVEKSD